MSTTSVLTTGMGIPSMIATAIDVVSGAKKETFATRDSGPAVTNLVLSMVNLAIWFGALYYAFKCGNPFDFLAACCCSICYLAYRMAVGCP